MLIKRLHFLLAALRHTPLAWLQLFRERVRLLVGVAGIAFAALLMFMQLGFRSMLAESAVAFHAHLDAQIVLISPASRCLTSMRPFSRRSLYRLRKIPEVSEVMPVYVGDALWKDPTNPASLRSIRVYGINAEHPPLTHPGLVEHLKLIRTPDVVLYDIGSRTEFGPVVKLVREGGSVTTEVENRRIRVGGLFEMGVSFGQDGALVTSDVNFLRLFGGRRTAGLIDIGAVRLAPGVAPRDALAQIQRLIGPDVRAMTLAEYKDFEQNYWLTTTPIGFVFTLGAAMGFLVGVVIVYQVLYTDVANHLAQYATLKAMGYTDRYFLGVVFQCAAILAALGFVPGVVVSWLLYAVVRSATLLPIAMSLERCLLVLGLTFAMCFFSGAIAVRKLREADPADVF